MVNDAKLILLGINDVLIEIDKRWCNIITMWRFAWSGRRISLIPEIEGFVLWLCYEIYIISQPSDKADGYQKVRRFCVMIEGFVLWFSKKLEGKAFFQNFLWWLNINYAFEVNTDNKWIKTMMGANHVTIILVVGSSWKHV